MSTKNRTRRTTTRNIRFSPNQMIEQINIALEQKGSGNFSAWVIEACRRRLTSEKRAYTSIKSDEEWTSRVLPSEQDDIVNSLNYAGIKSNWVAVLPLSWQWQTVCWLCHRLNSLNDYAMVISQPPGNNPSYYYRASPTLPQLLWMLPETHLMFYTCNYNIRVTHRNGAIHIYTNQIHGGSSADCSLFILSLHALALHLAVKM